jgi:type II secretory pathway component GspD/PulD (secretin)
MTSQVVARLRAAYRGVVHARGRSTAQNYQRTPIRGGRGTWRGSERMTNCRGLRHGFSILLSCTLIGPTLGGPRASEPEAAESETSPRHLPARSPVSSAPSNASAERAEATERNEVAERTEAAESPDSTDSDQPSQLSETSDVWQSSVIAAEAGKDIVDPERLRFNFSSARWRDVLEWFAGAAQMNLNWREMPEGSLNLITRGSYDVSEAQDVLNMHLLARGFTLLEREHALFLVKLDETLNPTMVPRVRPEDLDERGSYEYVKVSLPLDWMLAEAAANELAPILSPYGKIIPLTATNRIEAMDAVSNLRELRNLLQGEQSDSSQERLVVEFHLQYASALEVIEKLNQLLGLEKPAERMSRDQMRMAREQMALRAEMVKRLGEQAAPFEQKGPDVHLVANERQNSILANAAPDKIAVIRQAVQALDVPNDDQGIRLTEVTTMKVYPLNGAEADAVASILEELRDIGKLHPSSRFSEDDDRQILFAYASLQDHLTIKSVMDQLAGSARNFQVIPLRQLKAAYVADSIRTLMQGAEAEARSEGRDRSRRRRRETNNNNNSWSGFRVDADLPNNRLFLFATAAESEQVEELLVKLGERLGLAGNQRFISVSDETIDETIERVRSLWPSMSAHPLRIEVPADQPRSDDSSQNDPLERDAHESDAEETPAVRQDEPQNAEHSDAPQSPQDSAASKFGQESVDRTALAYHPAQSRRAVFPVADLGRQTPAFPRQFGDPAQSRPVPVYIRQGRRGELILRSEDREALDQLESLVWSSLPQTKPYTVFRLQHVSPYSIELTLQEIFASDGVRATTPLKFVSDSPTRSIMVFGAGDSELREIEDLIDFYDQPLAGDPATRRKPRFIELQYANAQVVANVIKDLYRDVLSANDRALDQPRGERSQAPSTIVSVSTGDDRQPQFKGLLSIGTFADTNTLIVSAPQYLSDEIEQAVRELDRDEAATVTSVVRIGDQVNGALIAERLSNLMSPTRATRTDSQAERQTQPEQRQPRSRSQQPQAQPRNDNDDFRQRRRQNGQRSESTQTPRSPGNRR